MKRVILTRGLPASGKTTWANEFMKSEPGRWKKICKDDLRAMLDNSAWSKKNESFVLEVRDSLILAALDEGWHVIVCDTNLNPTHAEHIRALVAGKATIEFQDFLDVSVEECIARDLKRLDSVGERVIREQYNKWLAVKPKPPELCMGPSAVVVDLDGTLALHIGRSPYDWDKCIDDELNWIVIDAVRSIQQAAKLIQGFDVKLLIVSGRDSIAREATEKWLWLNNIAYDALWMRPEGDKRKDVVIKEEIYRREIEGKYNVKVVFDDRDQVVEFWRSLGLTCFQVANGNF